MHLLFLGLSLAAAAYLLPTIVAAARGHRQTLAIFILNLFLGWSGLGWVAALIWACTNPPPETIILQR
jgi:hypothetical protein